ncbi:uncharacterized protein LOC125748041 [Brienomyrus brachyistius]|uniref:uncharacterized protein LOC125748041 n=1 Tax=Brienomyrus brachyistius TaxID=42636 RepID=UPI0020B24B81|nr:uncharacterized protein LOC125748041 [Brienomyrus brachyistius]
MRTQEEMHKEYLQVQSTSTKAFAPVQFISESSIAAAHSLFENVRYWLKSQEQCAGELDEIAKDLDEIRRNVNVAKVVGCSIATAVSAGCLIATIFTGGLAAPLLVASVAGSAGTVTTLIASYIEGLKSSDRFKKQTTILNKAEKVASEMKASLVEMVNEIGRTGVTLEELEEMLTGRNTSDLSADKMVVLYHFFAAVAHHNRSFLEFDCHSQWIIRALADRKMPNPLFKFLEGMNGEIQVPLKNMIYKGLLTTGIIGVTACTFVKKKAKKKASEMVIREVTMKATQTAVKNNVIKQGSKVLTREVTKTAARTAVKISCGIGLAISLVELVDVSLDLAKDKPTEASAQLRDTAKTIRENVREIRSMLDSLRKIIEDLEGKWKKEAEEKKKEAEEQRKKEAEEQRKKEAEEQRKKEAEEQRKKEAEEQRKKEAEEQRKKEAEEQRKKEAEEQRKKEAEEQRKKEVEEKKKKEAKGKRPKTGSCQARWKVLLFSFIIFVVYWIPKSQLMFGNQEGQQSQMVEKGVMDTLSTTKQLNKLSTKQLNKLSTNQLNKLSTNQLNKLSTKQLNKLSTNQGNKTSKTQSCDQPDLELNSQEINEKYQKFLRQHYSRDKKVNICNKLMTERKIIGEKPNKCKVINTFIITDSKNSIKDVCDKGGEDYCEDGKILTKSIKHFQVVICTIKNQNAVYPHCDYRQQESSRYIVIACIKGLPVHYEK